MKKDLPLNESISSSLNKKSKEILLIKNKDKEKENNKLKSPIPIRRHKKSETKLMYKYQKNNCRTPLKNIKKDKIIKSQILDNNNECTKINNNSTVVASNEKHFLVKCLLGNNRNNIDKCQIIKLNNNIFSLKKKTKENFKRFDNRIKRRLLPSKKQSLQKKNNKRYFKQNLNINNSQQIEKNDDNNNLKDDNDVNNTLTNPNEKILIKEENKKDNNNLENNDNHEEKFFFNKSDNTKIINNYTNKLDNEKKILNSDNNIKHFNRNAKSKSDLKIIVNTSTNIKGTENSNKRIKTFDLSKSVKTPNNFFKTKLITNYKALKNNKDKNESKDITENKDNNTLTKSANLVPLNNLNNNNNSNLRITKKNSVKSNSLDKFINNKKLKFQKLLVNKNLFNLVKNKQRNSNNNNLSLILNNTNANKFLFNKKKEKKNMKENKSCDNFLCKENSVDNFRINIKVINDNNNQEINNKNENKNFCIKGNFNIRKNNFINFKITKKFKKHKSQDFSKNTLNSLVISQNDVNNFNNKKENKTPEKNSQKILKSFQKELNNNNNHNSNNNSKKANYIYNILPGNNGKLIEKCLLNRNNWEIAPEDKKNYCNFIWTPLSCQINYSIHSVVETTQLVNHFEYHSELTNKSKTFINLFRYCEFNDINLFSFYPLTIIFNFNSNNFNSQIESFKKLYNDIPNLIINEQDKEGNKNMINKYYIDYFNVNLSKLIGSVQKMKIPKTYFAGKNMWLLKRDNLNRGRKIKVLSSLDDILKEINTLFEQKSTNNLLIQKYLEEPLLYHKRKFDIRIWVLFTYIITENKYEVYVFKEGHLKACSDEFNIDSDDLFIHLTNYSVQKYNKNFSKTEIGNEISFNDFQKELNEKNKKEGKNLIDFRKNIFPEIIKIIARSANAIKGKINLSNRNNCFELFGYDFILDINYKPFLLEINTNPGYEESSPLIKMLVPRMIDDAMKLTIDKEFETTYKTDDIINERNEKNTKISNYNVEGYSSEENMWLKIKTKL